MNFDVAAIVITSLAFEHIAFQRRFSAEAGNLRLAQKLLGHSSVDMTAEVYTHTSAEAEHGTALALAGAIDGDLFPVVSNLGNRNNSAAFHWRSEL